MRDVLLTMDECAALLVMLRCAADTTAECEALQTAARLGAERAMQAPDGDLSEMLTKLSRLRGWYEIGPAQRAEVDTLVEWVKMRAQERAARVCDRLRGPIEIYNPSYVHYVACAEAIRRGEGEQA